MSEDWQQIDVGPLRFEAPADWAIAYDVMGAVVAVRSDRASFEGFHANVNIVERESPVTELDELLGVQRAEIETLWDALVLDAGTTEVGGRPATRVLATHRSNDHELTLDQVMLPVDDSVVTISATAATSQYAAVAEAFDAIIATVVLDG